ncbi:MAG TPA: PAS domain-containing sensor histidine kinase [Sphingobacteriaceae bacterium]
MTTSLSYCLPFKETAGFRGAALKTFLETLPGALFRRKFDENWTLSYVSQGIEALTGYTAAELTENRDLAFSDLIYPEDSERIWVNSVECLKHKKDLVLEYRLSGKDGEVRWVKEIANGVYNEAGKLLYIEGYLADITLYKQQQEVKKTEDDNERLIREINNQYNELMQFSYIVSHNLRLPVANILGSSYLLEVETDEGEKRQLMKYISQSAESIDQLIKDLNNILAARSPLNEKIEQFSLTEIIQSTLHLLEKQIKEANAVFEVEVDPTVENLKSIKSYIQSAILNLISNAIKYKSADRQLKIRVSAQRKEKTIEIQVCDNGVGMDLDTYGTQLFGLYKRFHRHIEGKGLGLHMTKMQIELLGGSIRVNSEIDKGTTFTILLTDQ